jgi:hypothetical protein
MSVAGQLIAKPAQDICCRPFSRRAHLRDERLTLFRRTAGRDMEHLAWQGRRNELDAPAPGDGRVGRLSA